MHETQILQIIMLLTKGIPS